MKTAIVRFIHDEQGQDLVEYALIVAAIALGLIAAVQRIGVALVSLYDSISTSLGTISPSQ